MNSWGQLFEQYREQDVTLKKEALRFTKTSFGLQSCKNLQLVP